jgi:hypothetical protein
MLVVFSVFQVSKNFSTEEMFLYGEVEENYEELRSDAESRSTAGNIGELEAENFRELS